MSLGVVVKGPEGLVLAADSRVTLSAADAAGQVMRVSFDNATKLLSFSEPNSAVGAVTYGQAGIGLRTAQSFVPEFEATLRDNTARRGIEEFAGLLSAFYGQQWDAVMPATYADPPMTFIIAGFDVDAPYGRVFQVDIPYARTPVERNPSPGEFGISWGGQREFVDRLVAGYDGRALQLAQSTLSLDAARLTQLQQALLAIQMPIPLQAMPLQDCVDLAIFFIRTTTEAQRLTFGIRGVGGPIDVATITRRDGLRFVQRKRVVGERLTSVTPVERGSLE